MFGCLHKIIRIFWKNLYRVLKSLQFVIYLIKLRINNPISDISTSRKVEFFGSLYFWKYLFCVFYPLCFCAVSYNTRCDKISFFSFEVWMNEPFFREVFIGFTAEYFIFHGQNV